MRFHDIEQNSDEWLDLRVGKLTASSVSKVMANYGKAFGEPAKKLAVKIAREQITGKRSDSDSFSNAHTERGHEQEPIAKMLYESKYFVDVSNGGFFEDGICGCSPDGLVYDDGLIEIKSVIDHVHHSTIKRSGVDPAYKWQVLYTLLKTGRKWIDFVSYCADFPENTRLFIHRVNASECLVEFEMIKKREIEFFDIVEDAKKFF